MKTLDARLLVTLLAIGIFAWAIYQNPNDQTLIGAAIAGFNLALGYWLASSRGSAIKTELLSSREKD